MKYKIVFEKKSCIGAGECAAISPQLWQMQRNNKAELRGAVLNEQTGKYELIIDEKEALKQKLVVGSCPANCIKVEKI